jgi:hypothetical protein
MQAPTQHALPRTCTLSECSCLSAASQITTATAAQGNCNGLLLRACTAKAGRNSLDALTHTPAYGYCDMLHTSAGPVLVVLKRGRNADRSQPCQADNSAVASACEGRH